MADNKSTTLARRPASRRSCTANRKDYSELPDVSDEELSGAVPHQTLEKIMAKVSSSIENSFNERISKLENSLNERTSTIEVRMSSLENSLSERISTIEVKMSSLEISLNDKVSTIERSLNDFKEDQTSKFETFMKDISDFKAVIVDKVEKISAKNEELQKAINEINLDVPIKLQRHASDTDKKIESLEAEIKSLKEASDEKFAYMAAENKSHKRTLLLKEAESLSTNIILSGEALRNSENIENLTDYARQLIRERYSLNVPSYSVTKAYRLGSSNLQNSKILLKLSDKEVKKSITQARKIINDNVNPALPKLFISEELSTNVNKLFYFLRTLKRNQSSSIHSVFTRDGVIRVRKTETGRVYEILTEEDYANFLSDAGLQHPSSCGPIRG